MKKVITTLGLAVGLASSASAYSYATPGVATAGSLTGLDMQPTISLEGLYGIAAESDAPDMAGARLGFSLITVGVEDVRHQFGFYVAPMWGDTTMEGVDIDAQLTPITFGYDINIAMSEKSFFSLGVKAGYAFGSLDASAQGHSMDFDADGFTYSVGASLKVFVTDNVHLKAGYEYSRSYLDTGSLLGDYTYGSHVISLGVGCTF